MKDHYVEEQCKQYESKKIDALCRLSLSVWHRGIAKEEQKYKLIKEKNISSWLKSIITSDDTVEIDGLEIVKYMDIRQMVESIIEFLYQNTEKNIVLALPFETHEYVMNEAYDYVNSKINSNKIVAEINSEEESIVEILCTLKNQRPYLRILANQMCKYAYIDDNEIVRGEFEIEKELFKELVKSVESYFKDMFTCIGMVYFPNIHKRLKVTFAVKESGSNKYSRESMEVDFKYLKEYRILSKILYSTQAIEFINFIKENGAEENIKYIYEDLENVCSMPPRHDGRKLCQTLRNIRKEFAELNGINVDFTDCSNISEICSGTCEVCDYEVKQINKEAEKLENVKYPKIKVD